MNEHEKIIYVEFPSGTKIFFTSDFAWLFIEYDPEYTTFSNENIDVVFLIGDNGFHRKG